MADVLTDRLLPLRSHAALAAVATLLVGAVYCQAHGQLTGVRAPLGVSAWWSVCGTLPSAVVLALALRHATRLSRSPALGVLALGAAFVLALALGDLAYAGALDQAGAWLSSSFRAGPLAAVLSIGAMALLWRPKPPAAVGRQPSPEPAWPVAPGELRVVRSAGNYLLLPLHGREVLVRLPLHVAARRLAPHGFVRVHRTALVNFDRARAVVRRGRRLVVSLDDGTDVAVGRAYARDIQARWSRARSRSSQEPGRSA